MTPIPKLTIPIGQLHSTLKLGKSICMFCSKNRNAKNEFGDGMAGLCTRDSGITADLNRQIDKRNHDANRADDVSDIRGVIEIDVSEPLAVVEQALRLPNQKAARVFIFQAVREFLLNAVNHAPGSLVPCTLR